MRVRWKFSESELGAKWEQVGSEVGMSICYDRYTGDSVYPSGEKDNYILVKL